MFSAVYRRAWNCWSISILLVLRASVSSRSCASDQRRQETALPPLDRPQFSNGLPCLTPNY